MEQAIFIVHTDETLKKQSDSLYADFGMAATTAITRENGMQAFIALREAARKNEIQDMSLEEINNEIQLARLSMEDTE